MDEESKEWLVALDEVQVKPKSYPLAKVAMKVTKLPIIRNHPKIKERNALPEDEQWNYWATDIYHGLEDIVRDHYANDPNFEKYLKEAKEWDERNGAKGVIPTQILNSMLEKAN